jgi:hypothetical protein
MTYLNDQQLAELLRRQGHPVTFTPRAPRRKDPRAQNESRDQQAVVKWWACVCKSYGLPERALKAFPLQGRRDARNGARMKAEGMRAGTLDMHLSVARGGYHSLWIENKTIKGVVSDEQKEEIAHLTKEGHCVQVCRHPQETIDAIVKYLNQE